MLASLLSIFLLATSVLADGSAHSQGFFPITSPSKDIPWIVGETNTVSWDVGLSANEIRLPTSFDLILQDPFGTGNKIRIATRVPLKAKSLAVTLADDVPIGSRFRLSIGNTWQGETFAISEAFAIYPAGTTNFTVPKAHSSQPTITLALDTAQGRGFAATLNGDPISTALANAATKLGAFGAGAGGAMGAMGWAVVVGVVGAGSVFL